MTEPRDRWRGDTGRALYRYLAWDSEVFGFAVAAIEPASVSCERNLHLALEAMQRDAVRLAYLVSNGRADDDQPRLAAAAGGRAVGERVTYESVLPIPAPPRRDAGPDIFEYSDPVVTPALRRLALAAGTHSRFRTDPAVGERVFTHIYDTWIRRSVAREIADTVLVARVGNEIRGVVTVRLQGAVSEIGLLAVDEASRGRGVGSGLVRAASEWGVERGAATSRVVTQGANSPARALYEHAGYHAVSSQATFHFWL